MKATANKVPMESASTLTPVSDAAPGSNIDQLRDIIFGGQMREYDKRFARMEERLAKEITDMREEVRQRCAALERYARDELESVNGQIRSEQQQHRELRAQLLEQTQMLNDDMQRRHADLLTAIDRESQRLRDEKADRTALSDLLVEVALRLRGESIVPRQG